jgi:hypothetical protein
MKSLLVSKTVIRRAATIAAFASIVGSGTMPTLASAQTAAQTTVQAAAQPSSGITVIQPPSHKACETGSWSSVTQGRPTGLAPGAAQGAYLWHDRDGWHLRVTHPGNDLVTFTGSVDSTRNISQVGRALESKDEVIVRKQRARVVFDFRNRGGIDGIDFRVGCSNSFTVSMQINGQPIANSEVFLGAQKSSPTAVPFRVERT